MMIESGISAESDSVDESSFSDDEISISDDGFFFKEVEVKDTEAFLDPGSIEGLEWDIQRKFQISGVILGDETTVLLSNLSKTSKSTDPAIGLAALINIESNGHYSRN